MPAATIASVVRHKRPGMTFGVYYAELALEQPRACVEAVKLPDGAAETDVMGRF